MKTSIQITPTHAYPVNGLEISYVRSSGPGGQNVNKVATKVQIKLDVSHLQNLLPTPQYERLVKKLRNKIDQRMFLHVDCSKTRNQKQNLELALEKLEKLLQKALMEPKKRRPTKPSKASKEKRLQTKKKRAEIKKMRQGVD